MSKGFCKHCKNNKYCVIHEEVCNGNGEEMFDCPDFEESEE